MGDNTSIEPPAGTLAMTGLVAHGKSKHALSRQHLASARLLQKRCADVESTIKTPTEDDRIEHRAYAISAVFSAAAFLEASINELYLDGVDGTAASFVGLQRPEAPALLATIWDIIERQSILEKYQKALRLAGCPPIPASDERYQNATRLVSLRNALFHYKPEWSDEKGVHAKLEKDLQGKFQPNPFSLVGAMWMPERCLGAGCAGFCIDAATTFSNVFTTTLGIPPRC